jgi:hypothetical protein
MDTSQMIYDVFTLNLGKSNKFGSRFQRKRAGEQYQTATRKNIAGTISLKFSSNKSIEVRKI